MLHTKHTLPFRCNASPYPVRLVQGSLWRQKPASVETCGDWPTHPQSVVGSQQDQLRGTAPFGEEKPGGVDCRVQATSAWWRAGPWAGPTDPTAFSSRCAAFTAPGLGAGVESGPLSAARFDNTVSGSILWLVTTARG